jgi:hypothetical protein
MEELLEVVLVALLAASGAVADAVAMVVSGWIVGPALALVASIEARVTGFWVGRRSGVP